MPKQKMIILLIGLTCFSSVSSFFTVICHDSDGHIAVEPVAHNHCECPESGKVSNQDRNAGLAIDSCNCHGHCTDTTATPNYIVSARKNVKPSTHKVFTANLTLKSISAHTAFFFKHMAVQSYELSSFYAPLRTVILLS